MFAVNLTVRDMGKYKQYFNRKGYVAHLHATISWFVLSCACQVYAVWQYIEQQGYAKYL